MRGDESVITAESHHSRELSASYQERYATSLKSLYETLDNLLDDTTELLSVMMHSAPRELPAELEDKVTQYVARAARNDIRSNPIKSVNFRKLYGYLNFNWHTILLQNVHSNVSSDATLRIQTLKRNRKSHLETHDSWRKHIDFVLPHIMNQKLLVIKLETAEMSTEAWGNYHRDVVVPTIGMIEGIRTQCFYHTKDSQEMAVRGLGILNEIRPGHNWGLME